MIRLLCLATLAAALWAQDPLSPHPPYDPSLPSPAAHLGYAMGERHTS